MRILIIIAALFMTLHAQVKADIACGERKPMIEQLRMAHQEQQRALGLASGGGIIEVFASPAGSWTILITRPNGITCIVSSGEAWEQYEAEPQGTKL